MNDDFSEAFLSVVVENIQTMTSPLTMKAFKNGIRVPLGKYLRPNNGFNSHQTFYDAVRQAVKFEPECDALLDKIVCTLFNHINCQETECCKNTDREKKLRFLTHQLQLLAK